MTPENTPRGNRLWGTRYIDIAGRGLMAVVALFLPCPPPRTLLDDQKGHISRW